MDNFIAIGGQSTTGAALALRFTMSTRASVRITEPLSLRACSDGFAVIGRRDSHDAPSSQDSAQYTPRIENRPPAESGIHVVRYVGPDTTLSV